MRQDILNKIAEERTRQDEMWGVQNHDNSTWYTILGEEVGEVGGAIQDVYFCDRYSCDSDKEGKSSHDHLKQELIHVAAVAVSFLEAIERREVSAG